MSSYLPDSILHRPFERVLAPKYGRVAITVLAALFIPRTDEQIIVLASPYHLRRFRRPAECSDRWIRKYNRSFAPVNKVIALAACDNVVAAPGRAGRRGGSRRPSP